jgi:two-component system, cell cycle sensor histidine kinase and response regulator CckA
MTTEPTANILVVDDDEKTLTAMEALLSGPGRTVITASSGQEALRYLLHREFALILLDVRMPDIDGFEAAALIRQRERLRHIPIIFLSAIDTLEEDVYRGVASGAVDYLFKPVVPQVLQAKVSVFLDLFHVNERLKQEAVRKSEERFRLVIESLQDYAVFMMNPEGRISLWNAAAEQIRGWREEEVIGQSFEVLYPREEREKSDPWLAMKRASADARYEAEGWCLRKDGSRFWGNVVYTAIRDNDGTLIGFSSVTRDLTERKRAEEELRVLNSKLEERVVEQTGELVRSIAQREKLQEQLLQAQKMESIGTLAGGIAHDFNNLLNLILGYASLLQQYSANPTQLSASIEVIKETVKRGSALVQQLLALARKTETKFQRIQVNGLLKSLQVLLQETFPKTIDVSSQLEAKTPEIMADPNQLHQAVLNLCLNSRDAMSDGGELLLQTGQVTGTELRGNFQEAREEQYVYIRVTDTGEGIDRTIRSRIFEPFFTTKTQGQGSGLGLSVVYGIVTSHGGFIDLASEPGRGTTFDIYLPVPRQEMTVTSAGDRVQEVPGEQMPGGGATILFVEDEVRQLTLMQKFLTAEGYRVLGAKDGAEAVELHLRHKKEIALVVLDLGLPKLNGWEAYKMMKEVDPNVRAIFATGFMSPELEVQMKKEQMSSVIMKPYELREALAKISAMLQKSPAAPFA